MRIEVIISIITMIALCIITSLFISYIIPQPYSIIINIIVGGFIGYNYNRIYNKVSDIVKEDLKE